MQFIRFPLILKMDSGPRILVNLEKVRRENPGQAWPHAAYGERNRRGHEQDQ